MKSWLKPGSAFNEQEQTPPPGVQIVLTPFLLILAMWVVYWLDVKFSLDLYQWGIFPRQWQGLPGVLASPFIHGNLSHLTNNTLPVLILGSALYYFYPRQASTVILISWIVSGLGVWLVARDSFHIGASGIIYALAGYIFLSGVLRGKANLLALSLLVVFVYGGLVWGILPIEERISYEAHAAGAASGFALAIIYRKTRPTDMTPSRQEDFWEGDDLSEQIEKYGEDYWKEYSGQETNNRITYHYKPKSTEQKE